MKKSKLINFLFVFPCVFSFIIVIIIPFFLGIYFSMTNWNGVSQDIAFIGLKNFENLFNSPDFLHSFMVTVAFTLMNILFVNVISFSLSLLVTSRVKLRNFYRAGFFVPNLIGGIVLGYIWQFLFNNALLKIGTTTMIGFLQSSLLSHPNTVIWAMSLVNTWQYAGYIMVIYVAAIQSIPSSYLEAANIDGANYWMRLRKILIPLVANAFTISLFLTLVNSFKQFDMNFVLTNGGPSTRFMERVVKSSQLLTLNIYDTAIANHLAEAQAKAVILFIALAIVSLIQVSINKRKEVEM